MKKYLTIIPFLLLMIQLAFSQQVDVNYIKQQEQGLALELENLNLEKSKLLQLGDSLAVPIQQLKSKQDLNIFQRLRMEQLLKSSQELDQKIVVINQNLDKLDREHQSVLRELVAWYNDQIERKMNAARTRKLSPVEQQQLSAWNLERSQYLKKIRHNEIQLQLSRPIEIEESDSYQTIKQKADLLRDQEDKARHQMSLIDKRVQELQSELKLRSRMNELIADTYLMGQPTEKSLPQNQPRGANENVVFSGADNSRAPASASLDAVDNLLLKADVSGISNLDLESQIRNLQQMKVRLNQSADSLRVVADQFYQAAEKKRQDENKK